MSDLVRNKLLLPNNIFIKNMVCNHCILVVRQIFKSAGIEDVNVQLGKVEVEHDIPDNVFRQIEANLNKVGFKIMSSQVMQMVEQIKNLSVNYVYLNRTDRQKINFSTFLTSKMNKDYNHLSTLFYSIENTTIEHYLINLKIERVKELLIYGEMVLSEIACEMGYSSEAHLSVQFKKNTGFTLSSFKLKFHLQKT
ncbi:MAG: helix-turn-helix domain-containing protein [Bacteroidales bacterium]|nr:helix-turn-helix domain-containing protein [Bacteroidales bacterium]